MQKQLLNLFYIVYFEHRLIFIVSQMFQRFFTKNLVLMNIREYANELICIFNTKLKGNVYALFGTRFVNLCST